MKEYQGQQQKEKDGISLAEILNLNHEIKEGLDPYASYRYNSWIKEMFNEVPQIEKPTIDEINAVINKYLSDDDNTQVEKYMQTILDWLHKCTNIGEMFSIYPYDRFVTSDMFGLKQLVKTAYERKARAEKEKAEAEEKDRQWKQASDHVFPLTLLKEAKRYLNRDDIDKLYDAAYVAIEVYLKEGDRYLDSYKTFDYRRWLKKIDYEKEKEQIHDDAQAQAQAFAARLDNGLNELENMLSRKKEYPAVRFKRYCSTKGETRYLGESFTDILVNNADRNRKWTQGYISAAEEKLQRLIPEEFQDFILAESTVAFFLLPNAHFADYGVPCLDYYFDVFAVVTIAMSAQTESIKFNGIPFDLLANLQEPKPLGYYQITITPSKTDFWQSIPLIIIRALLDGILQPPGTTISERTDELTVYEVEKFDMETCAIPISFERYCHRLGSLEKMKETQIIKERTAEILELSQPISINRKESKSKKAKAFQHYDYGNRPGSPEVKALGIKPETAYRYYQDWKKEAI
ncbi:hypothetical protein ACFLX7_00600 [Chloroflexota bacterium]